MNSVILLNSNDLLHYGVQGMRWGVRRYQPYPDGYMGDGRYVGNVNMRVQRHATSGGSSRSSSRRRTGGTPARSTGRSSRGRSGGSAKKATGVVKEKTTKVKDEYGKPIVLQETQRYIHDMDEYNEDANGYSSTRDAPINELSSNGAVVSTLNSILDAMRRNRG